MEINPKMFVAFPNISLVLVFIRIEIEYMKLNDVIIIWRFTCIAHLSGEKKALGHDFDYFHIKTSFFLKKKKNLIRCTYFRYLSDFILSVVEVCVYFNTKFQNNKYNKVKEDETRLSEWNSQRRIQAWILLKHWFHAIVANKKSSKFILNIDNNNKKGERFSINVTHFRFNSS